MLALIEIALRVQLGSEVQVLLNL